MPRGLGQEGPGKRARGQGGNGGQAGVRGQRGPKGPRGQGQGQGPGARGQGQGPVSDSLILPSAAFCYLLRPSTPEGGDG